MFFVTAPKFLHNTLTCTRKWNHSYEVDGWLIILHGWWVILQKSNRHSLKIWSGQVAEAADVWSRGRRQWHRGGKNFMASFFNCQDGLSWYPCALKGRKHCFETICSHWSLALVNCGHVAVNWSAGHTAKLVNIGSKWGCCLKKWSSWNWTNHTGGYGPEQRNRGNPITHLSTIPSLLTQDYDFWTNFLKLSG